MDDEIVNVVVQTIADVAMGGIGASGTGSRHDPVVYDLQRQLDESRRANRSLCDFLKIEFGLTDQQIAKAHSYKSTKPTKEIATICPHCQQRLFSRNTPSCNHCRGNLLASDR